MTDEKKPILIVGARVSYPTLSPPQLDEEQPPRYSAKLLMAKTGEHIDSLHKLRVVARRESRFVRWPDHLLSNRQYLARTQLMELETDFLSGYPQEIVQWLEPEHLRRAIVTIRRFLSKMRDDIIQALRRTKESNR